MKNLMGESHKLRILESIPSGGRYLEWGSGGSTIWLAHNVPENVEIISIEHDRAWAQKVKSTLKDKVNLIIAEGRAGRNATIEEEDPTCLTEYIHAADDLGQFDCILIDGVARTACGIAAQRLLKENGTIFIHDAQRWWYDGAKALFDEIETIPSCSDYPGPALWIGKKKKRAIEKLVIQGIADRIGGGFVKWLQDHGEEILTPVVPLPSAPILPKQTVHVKSRNNVMLHCNQVFWRGGTNLFTKDMAKVYPEFHHVNTYFYDGREDYEMMEEFECQGIDVSHINMLTEKIVKDINPAVIIFHNTPAELRGRKLVEGEWPFDWLKQWPLIAIHHNPSFPAFHAALDIFVSQNVLDRYANCVHRMNHKLIPPCIDLSKYRSIIRTSDNERCVIGKLTSNSPPRYPMELLRILEEVQKQVPHVGFSLIGAADHWDTSKLRSCETPPTGSRDTKDFYAGFDLFVHKNTEGTTDSWGRIISEAMAAGLPVVTENRGGPAEQVDHGVTGFLCDKDEEFTKYLIMLAKDPIKRHEMGLAGRKKAIQEYGIDRLRRETIDTILKIALGAI
jgi:glycosyltransferase involved in cell wall biosynthesis